MKTQAPTKTALPPVRWMIRRDMPEVLAIEERSYEDPWNEDEFIRVLRERNTIGTVAATPGGALAGFMIYELQPTSIELISLTVVPHLRRLGYGAHMFAKLAGKLTPRRNKIVFDTNESNLDALAFFRAQGCLATGLIRDYYESIDEDGIAMVRHYRRDEAHA